jgi:hypothetical protein
MMKILLRVPVIDGNRQISICINSVRALVMEFHVDTRKDKRHNK